MIPAGGLDPLLRPNRDDEHLLTQSDAQFDPNHLNASVDQLPRYSAIGSLNYFAG